MADITIEVNNKKFTGWSGIRATQALSNVADAFSFTAPFGHGSVADQSLIPGQYQKCKLFIDNELYISGEAVAHTPARMESGGTQMTVQVRAFPGVLVDCGTLDDQLDYSFMTLKQITEQLIKPFGIKANFPHGDSPQFDKVNRGISQKIFDLIGTLAKQAGFMVSTDTDMKSISFVRADTKQKPMAHLKEGEQPLIDLSTSFDSTKRFSTFTAMTQSFGAVEQSSTLKDDDVSAYRPIVFTAEESAIENLTEVLKWRKARTISDFVTVSAKVAGWRSPSGEIWRKNKLITAYSPLRCIYKPTTFLISGVTLQQGTKEEFATLDLVLPIVYNPDYKQDIFWRP